MSENLEPEISLEKAAEPDELVKAVSVIPENEIEAENLEVVAPAEPPAPVVAAPQEQAKPAKAKKSFWREVLETVLLTILIFFFVRAMFQNYRIEGTSMEPSFHPQELILVNKAAYFHFDSNPWLKILPWATVDESKKNTVWLFGGPHRGDVIVLEPPDVPTDDYIKRVIGLPGEKIEVRDGQVYINDKPLKEDYTRERTFSPYGPVVVPDNAVFVMGDNRNASRDSRIFGFLPFDKIVGKVAIVYWPFGDKWGLVPEAKYDK